MIHVSNKDAGGLGVTQTVVGEYIAKTVELGLNVWERAEDRKNFCSHFMFVEGRSRVLHQAFEYGEQRGRIHVGGWGWRFTDWVGLRHQKQT
jgi:hypothetical protein